MTVIDRAGAFGFSPNMVGVPTFQQGGFYVPNNAALPVSIFTIYGDVPKISPAVTVRQDNQTAPENNSVQNNPAVTQAAISSTPSTATPMQAGVGAGLASGLVSAMIESDKKDYGKYVISPFTPQIEYDLRKLIFDNK